MIHSIGVSGRTVVGALAFVLAAAGAAPAQSTAPAAAPMASKMPAAAPMASKMPAAAPMASTMPAGAMDKIPPPGLLKLSDTITLRNGKCWLVSDPTDSGTAIEKPEPKTPRQCRWTVSPVWNAMVSVPGDKEEAINFNFTIRPDGSIVGKGREGYNQAAYSCTITGKTKPGTKPGELVKIGGIIKVWEIPSLP